MSESLADQEFIHVSGLEDPLKRSEHLLTEIALERPNIGMILLLLRAGIPETSQQKLFDLAFSRLCYPIVREVIKGGIIPRYQLYRGLTDIFQCGDLTSTHPKMFARLILKGVGFPSHDFAVILHLAAAHGYRGSSEYLTRILGIPGGPLTWTDSR